MINIVADGDRVFVTYEGRSAANHRFRNTETLAVRGDKIADVEVYFGWHVPHGLQQARIWTAKAPRQGIP